MSARTRCRACGHARGRRRGKSTCTCACHTTPAAPATSELGLCGNCYTLPATTAMPVRQAPWAPWYRLPICQPCASSLGVRP